VLKFTNTRIGFAIPVRPLEEMLHGKPSQIIFDNP